MLPTSGFQGTLSALEGKKISLLTLQESNFDDLIALGLDKRIWAHYPADLSIPTRHLRHLYETMTQVQAGNCHAFIIVHTQNNHPVGMTRLFNLNAEHRQCEIGSWLAPDFWKNGMNTEAKFLLLQYCFETLNLLRVQFKTDTRNVRSRNALEKLGAHLEGIIRMERILETGTVRDAALYSIIESEWPQVKSGVLQKTRQWEYGINNQMAPPTSQMVSYVYNPNQTDLSSS